MRIYRRITQSIFLLLFLCLFFLTEATGENELGYPVRIFLDFDPLLALSSLLSSHTLAKGFLYALFLMAITLVMGRVFCGWICPLGALHDAVGAIAGARRSGAVRPRWFRCKYYLLFFILASSLVTVQCAGYLDPLSLLIRSLALSIWPACEYAIRAIFDGIYFLHIPCVTTVSESLYGILKKTLLSFTQPFFFQGFAIGALFVGILALNLWERRFWCRYICPLGALLGVVSRWSAVRRRVSEGCTACGTCRSLCPSGAIIDDEGRGLSSECLVCLECDDRCPAEAISFGWNRKGPAVPIDIERRTAMAAVAAGLATAPLLRITPRMKEAASSPFLIRPPGARAEPDFLAACVRCGECMKVCITNGLQPALLQAGIEGIWTPVLVPRIGHCEYRCTLCGQVCPTGALKELTVQEKAEVKIGMAVIDRGRCLPHANGIACIVCEEVCPTAPKAIRFNEVSVRTGETQVKVLKQPYVNLEQCVGCGACEADCPVAGKPAIYVISTGESRSEANRVLL